MGHIHKTLKKDGRLLLAEYVVSEPLQPNDPSLQMDMGMLLYGDGMERTLKHWQKLFSDTSFEYINTYALEGLSLIEARPI